MHEHSADRFLEFCIGLAVLAITEHQDQSERRIMAAIDDLNAAIANIGTAVDAAANDIATLKATQATAVPADQVQAAATAAQGLADKLTAALG